MLAEGTKNPKCSIEEMHLFIRHQVPRWLYEKVVKGEMSEDTFGEWVKDHKKYISSLPGSSEGVSVLCETSAIESEEEGGGAWTGCAFLFYYGGVERTHFAACGEAGQWSTVLFKNIRENRISNDSNFVRREGYFAQGQT